MNSKLMLTILCACSSAAAFTTEPGQKLSPHVTYCIQDAELEASFLSGFKEWNDATDNHFDLQKIEDASVAVITVVPVSSLPSNYVGLTFNLGNRAIIQILRPPPVNVLYGIDRVMMHEIGHALGLGHTLDKTAMMYFSTYANMLTVDDVAGVRSVYGLGLIDISLGITVKGRRRNRIFSSNYPAIWDFGDGSSIYKLPVGNPIAHHFPARGWYTVTASYIGVTQTLVVRIR